MKGIGHATARRFTVAAGLPDELGAVVAAFRGPDREHYLTMLKDLLYNAEQREAVLQRLSAYCRLAAEHERSWLHAPNFVIKEYMEDGATRDDYIMDVEMQMIAKFWGEQFNLSNPPKKVDVLRASLIEFPDRPGSPIYACEAFMEGDYVKYNSNSGYVSEIGRVTPQAFSHFTFVASKGQLMVIDIQVRLCFGVPRCASVRMSVCVGCLPLIARCLPPPLAPHQRCRASTTCTQTPKSTPSRGKSLGTGTWARQEWPGFLRPTSAPLCVTGWVCPTSACPLRKLNAWKPPTARHPLV